MDVTPSYYLNGCHRDFPSATCTAKIAARRLNYVIIAHYYLGL